MKDDLGTGFIQAANTREGTFPVTLVTIQLPGDMWYMHNTNEAVITALNPAGDNNVDYIRSSLKLGVLSENINNEYPRLTLTVGATPDSVASGYVKAHTGLRGQSIWITRTFRHLIGEANEATNRSVMELVIDSGNVNDTTISFGLATNMELANSVTPKRIYNRNFCTRTYSSTGSWEDGYCPDALTCNRTKQSCTQISHFGGFLGIAIDRRYFIL